MSILVVQRPHNVPGLISMNRQQSTPKRASPRQNHRPTYNQSNHHVPNPVATVLASVPVLSPKLNRKQQHSTSHAANQSMTESPLPAPLPSDSPRRNKHVKAASQEQNGTGGRKRSSKASRQATPPVHLDELDTGLPEWDSPAPIVDTPQSKPRMKRTPPGVITIGTPSPKGAHTTNWQQAALFRSQAHTRTTTPLTVSGLPSGGGPKTAPIQGSFSAPSSPERFPNVPNQHPLQVISRSPTAPNLPSAALSSMTRPGRHMRTPSFPNFPINRPDNRFVNDESPDVDPLEALFRSATLSSPSTPQLAGSAPADSSIHARVAKAKKGKKGTASAPATTSKDDFMFASASFQAAPDAMVFPKPGGLSPFATKPAAVPFGGPRLERLSFNLNEDEDSFDESEEDASSDAGVDRPVNPSLFVM